MKKFLKKLWAGISKAYKALVGTTQRYVPIAINIVEQVKKVMDSPVDDIILSIVTAAIPGDADDKLVAKVKGIVEEWLPKILLELQIVDAIAGITDPNEQIKAILAKLKFSSKETQNIFFHGFCSLLIEKLSDGNISWSDSVALSEYCYQNRDQL